MLTDIAKKLGGGFVLATALMAGQAQAASFVGSWDPAFGNPFPNLGWEGEVKFFVPDACLLESGTVNNSNACSNGGMDLTSALVRFYKLDDPTEATQATLTFTGLDALDQFISITVLNGMVTGLRADFNEWVLPDPTLTMVGWPLPDKEFNLEFEGDCARLRFRTQGDASEQGGGGGVSDPCTNTGGGPFLSFSREGAVTVPEPGSLALLLPAVGMLAALRRRRPAPAAA